MWYRNSAGRYYNLDHFVVLRTVDNNSHCQIRGEMPDAPDGILIESACPSEEEAKELLNALLTSTLPLLMWKHFRVTRNR